MRSLSRLLCERVRGFGVDLAQACTLVVVEWDELEPGQAARRMRAGSLAAGAIADDIDGVPTVLCQATRAEEVRRQVAELAREAGASGAYRGIVSRSLARPTEIPGVYMTLRRALPVLARMGVQGQLVAQAEMSLYAALFETHDKASLAAFLEATLGALITHDEKRGSGLAGTLLCYFDCGQNAKLAATRLGIHVNTMRQRLATIQGLLGDWSNAVHELELHMALRLWSLGG